MTAHALTAVRAGFALLHVAVVLAPAVVLAVTAEKGGIAGLHGYGLLATSGVVGTAYAVIVWRRLRRLLRDELPLTDAVIAAFNGLVVLALAASILLFVVLGAYAPTATILLNEGWPLVVLWTAVQLVAVGMAEVTRRGVARWLRRPAR